MPTYVYRCTADHEFEVVQRITEDALTACAECGGSARRVVLPVGIVFKGSGFYKTDSRRSESGTTPAAPPAGGKPQEAAAAANGNGSKPGSAQPAAPAGPAEPSTRAAGPPPTAPAPAAPRSATPRDSGGGGAATTTPARG